MFETKSADHDCNDTPPPMSSKSRLLWRRTFCVSIFMSLKKNPCKPEKKCSDPDSDGNGISLGASLHVTTTTSPTKTPPSTPTSSGKFGRFRRLSICVSFFIYLRKTSCKRDVPPDLRIDMPGSNLGTEIDGGEVSQVWSTSNPVHAKGLFYYFLKACNSYTIFLLLVSAGLSFGVEVIEQGRQDGWHDGVAILFALFLIVTFPSVANFLSARKLEKKLRQKKNKLTVEIVRSGDRRFVAVSDLVEGDIVHLKEGDLVPADGLYVSGDGLVLDEIVNSKIDCDGNPSLCTGSKVKEGHGSMLIGKVGAKTVLGKVVALEIHNPNEKIFLEAHIDKPNSYIENLSLSVSVLIALVVFISLLCGRQRKNDDVLPELKGNVSMGMLMKIFESIFLRPTGRVQILTGALTAIVIGVQHGMPFVITVSLSYRNKKLEFCGAKPQNLLACGTMGLATVICIDATGGLIHDQVEVNKFFIGGKDMNIGTGSATDQVVLEALQRAIGLSVPVPAISVSSPHDPLIAWANSRLDMNMELVNKHYSVLNYGRMSSKIEGSKVLMKENAGDGRTLHLHLKGAASTILNLCSHYYDSRGEIHAIEGHKRNFEQLIGGMEGNGLRTIAFACKQTEDQEPSEEGLHLLAIIGLKYSFLGETKRTIESLRSTGVSIKLVSQDALSVVRRIACELEIFQPGSNVVELEGEQIGELMNTAGMERIEQAVVIGSCSSEDKLLVVQCLQKKDHVVAFYGGSTTSDVPAVKEADVGITKETQSTEMARESSDIFIPNIQTLLAVLKFGRCAYLNIQKFTQLQLTACISGLLINLVAAMCFWDSPLTSIQIIWVNFIMCLLGGLMMVMEFSSQELIPSTLAKKRSLVTQVMWKNILIQVFYQASVLLILHLVAKATLGINEDVWKSLVFNSFMLCQVFNQFIVMDLFRKEVIEVVFHSYWFLVALVAVISMQVLFVEFAGSLAGCVRLNMVHWASSFIIAALSWGFECAVKFISASISTWFSRSDGSHIELSRRRPWFCISYLGIPLSILFFYSLSYYFEPENAQTFR